MALLAWQPGCILSCRIKPFNGMDFRYSRTQRIDIKPDTEIILRYSPEYHRRGIDMSLKGIGIKLGGVSPK